MRRVRDTLLWLALGILLGIAFGSAYRDALAAPVRYLSPGYDNACTIQGSVTVTGASGGLATTILGGVTVIIGSNTGTSATLTVSAPAAGLNSNIVNGVTVIIGSNTGTSATLTVSAPAAGLNTNIVNGVTVIIASNTGTSATMIIGNPISQGDVNNASKAQNMGVTTFRDSSGGALGGGAVMAVTGGDVNRAAKMQAVSVSPFVGSMPGNAYQVIDLFNTNNTAAGAYEMVGATPITDSGSTARGNALYAVIGADTNNAGRMAVVSTTFYNNSSSGASGKAGSALAVASIGACGMPTATPLAVTVANGGTIVLPSGTVAFEVRMKGGTAIASGLIGTATDFVSVATDAMVSASNGSGVIVTHESSNVTAVAGAVHEGPWKVKDLNLGATGGTLYMVPAGGTVVVEVIYQTVR